MVLEAMKMQNEIRASRRGIVGRVEVVAGTTVDGGALWAVTAEADPGYPINRIPIQEFAKNRVRFLR